MAKKADAVTDTPAGDSEKSKALRLPAEMIYAEQLEALRQNESDKPPSSWKLSPRSVLTYIVGGKHKRETAR